MHLQGSGRYALPVPTHPAVLATALHIARCIAWGCLPGVNGENLYLAVGPLAKNRVSKKLIA